MQPQHTIYPCCIVPHLSPATEQTNFNFYSNGDVRYKTSGVQGPKRHWHDDYRLLEDLLRWELSTMKRELNVQNDGDVLWMVQFFVNDRVRQWRWKLLYENTLTNATWNTEWSHKWHWPTQTSRLSSESTLNTSDSKWLSENTLNYYMRAITSHKSGIKESTMGIMEWTTWISFGQMHATMQQVFSSCKPYCLSLQSLECCSRGRGPLMKAGPIFACFTYHISDKWTFR